MMSQDKIPKIDTIIFGKRMSYFCDSCNRKHTHGAGEVGIPEYRISHCPKPYMICLIPKQMCLTSQ